MRLRLGAFALIVLGLAMLGIGVWVEDRDAVAAPLVILGALLVVAGVIFEGWRDVEELGVSAQGVTFRRRPPSAEQLTQAGLPEPVAKQIEAYLDEWTEDLLSVIAQPKFKPDLEFLGRVVRGPSRLPLLQVEIVDKDEPPRVEPYRSPDD